MKTHPHVATPYEIKAAAEQRLKAIVLPIDQDVLQPRILLKYDPKDGMSQETTIDPGFWSKIPYREGDRIYLQEKWKQVDFDMAGDEGYFSFQRKSQYPDSRCTDWHPAEMMPIQAAQHWFAINEVKVCQCKDLKYGDFVDAGIFWSHAYSSPEASIAAQWNAAYPGKLWHGDRHVIVLQVEAIAQ